MAVAAAVVVAVSRNNNWWQGGGGGGGSDRWGISTGNKGTVSQSSIAKSVNETVLAKTIRGRDVILHAVSMCPDTVAKVFLDEEDVTAYCQPANQLQITNVALADEFDQGDGIVNTTTYAFAKVMDTSNDIIYTDENYLNIKIQRYGNLAMPNYVRGDIIYQASSSSTYFTLVSSYPKSNPSPLYRNTQTGYGWSSWMINHAVWESNSSAGSHSYIFPNVYFEAGAYTANYAIDNTGTITVGSNQIVNVTNGSNNSWTGSGLTVTFTIDVSGDYPVSWSCANSGGPGGISLVITKNSNSVVFFDTANAYTTQLTKEYHVQQNFQGVLENVSFINTSGVITAVLSIKPEFGTFNSDASSTASIIRRMKPNITEFMGSWDIAALQTDTDPIISGDVFPVGSTIRNTKNSITAVIASYSHRSGAYIGGATNTSFYSQGKYSYAANDYLTISGGSGIKQTKLITGVTPSTGGNLLTLSSSSSLTGLTANSRYSLGPNVVDDYGTISLIFNIPEDVENKFQAGSKTLTIVNASISSPKANNYLMRASHSYSVSIPPSETQTPSLPVQQYALPIPPPARRDPIAQTFFVPGPIQVNTGENTAPYGIFCSSIDLWFSAKPYTTTSQLPVIVRIVDVQLGTPTQTIIAETYAQYKDVKIPSTYTFDASSYTKFTFKDPVFLSAGKEYAIVVQSDSPDYFALICDLDVGYVLGTNPPRRVSQQPNSGSFFKSQNGSTWTPIQSQDLVFRINKCVFEQDTYPTIRFKPKNQKHDILADAVVVSSSESNYKPTNTKYWVKAKGIGAVEDISETYLKLNSIYSFGSDLKTSLKDSHRRKWIACGDEYGLNVGIQLTSSDRNVSPIVNKDKLTLTTYTSIISDGGISNTHITVTSGGLYENVSNIFITVSSPDDPNGITANAYVYSLAKRDNNGKANVDVIMVDTDGAGYYSTPQMRIIEKYDVGTIKSNTTSTLTATTAAWTTSQWTGYDVEVISTSVSCGSFVVGQDYIIDFVGTTDFTELGASTNCVGIKFTATATGNSTKTGKAKIYCVRSITDNTSDTLTISGTFPSGMPTVTTSLNTGVYTYKIINPVRAATVISGETNSSGGNCETRYITKRVDLAEGFDAGDLRVYLDCVRPRGTNVNVYYKVKSATDSDTFDSKKWQLMYKVSDIFSPDQQTLIQLEYIPKFGGDPEDPALTYFENGVTYPKGGKFIQFALKIVLTADDPTVAPYVTNFSAIATPAG